MLSDLGLLLLTTVACFQLSLSVDPFSALAYANSEDRKPTDTLQRWYLAKPSDGTPASVLTRYLIDEGVSSSKCQKTIFIFSVSILLMYGTRCRAVLILALLCGLHDQSRFYRDS